MTYISITCLLLLVFAQYGMTAAPYGRSSKGSSNWRECEPGTTFKVDCNTCFCGEDGKVGGCTLMACINGTIPWYPDGEDNNKEVQNRCKPNTTFAVDCNTCTCGPDGKVKGCTRMQCPHAHLDDRKCTPGRMFMIDCNTCQCPYDGKVSHAPCTLKGCQEHTGQITEL